MNTSKKIIWKNIISISAILIVAGLGTLFVNLGMEWFGSLAKPTEWVSNIVFPIVWTTVYLIVAVLNFLWIKKAGVPKDVLILEIINGALNVLWCLIFFTLNSLLFGLITIILNLIFAIILWTSVNKQDKVYSYFLAIYPIWIAIATTLNLAVWILN